MVRSVIWTLLLLFVGSAANLICPFREKNGAIQWVSSFHDGESALLSQTLEGQLFLSGVVWDEAASFVQRVTHVVESARFERLATIVEKSAGCYIDAGNTVYLWVGFAASNESVFYRIDGSQLLWSTNPSDLINSESEIDLWSLRRCCHGDDVFIYPGLQRVEQGHLVKILPDRRVIDYQFDVFLPDPQLVAGHTTIESFVDATQVALRKAVQPLARLNMPVGFMLSGGVGSAALLAAMKQEHIPVIAYNMESPDPAGSEYQMAQAVSKALDIPLQRIEMDTGPDYLSFHTNWVHPYGHPWARWYEQLAEQMRQDNLSLLVIGAGDDSSFGPDLEYSVYSVLATNLPWQEKTAMIQGMFSMDWNVFDILRSAWPWPPRQLIGVSSLAGPTRRDRVMRSADFLTFVPPRPRAMDDASIFHAPCFAAQSMAIGQALEERGIQLYYPYHDRCVQAVSQALPPAYRIIPQLGNLLHRSDIPVHMMSKPILRLAWEKILPPEVTWRTWPTYNQAPIQRFCLNHREILVSLLGSGSSLAHIGIADPSRLAQVLSQKSLIRENYLTLVTSCMVEIFLRQAQQQWKRGGPAWV